MTKYFYQNIEEKNRIFIEEECQYYFRKLFGDTPPFKEITFNIFERSNEKDSIKIVVQDDRCLILGSNFISLLIAFYRLLNEFGVHFLRPGKRHDVFPKETNKIEYLNLVETASFNHRGVCIEGGNSLENVLDFIDWLPKIGMNSFFVQFENPHTFLERWYQHINNPYLEKEIFDSERSNLMSRAVDEAMELRGIVHHRVGHGWTGEVLGYSSKYGWDASDKLTRDLQPLVAEVNGKRELIDGVPILTNLCMSNKEAIKKFVEVVVEYAKSRQDVEVLHVWLSDAVNTVCECKNCQNENFSDQYVELLNSIDLGFEAANLSTKICFLLYHELLYAPKSKKINNPNRFIMMFAPITRSFEESYSDINYSDLEENQLLYDRNKLVIPKSLIEQLKFLKSWQKVFDGDSFVYDYPLGRAHYGDFGYMAISDIIARDIKALDKLSLNGYISCQELRAGMPTNLPNYIMGHLLWNNKLDPQKIKEEYFKVMYGEGYERVIEYLSRVSELSSCDYFNGKGDRINISLAQRYSVVYNIAQDFLYTIVQEIPKHSGRELEEWKILSYHREVITELANILHEQCMGKQQEANSLWLGLSDKLRRDELSYQPYLDIYRIHMIAKYNAGLGNIH